MDHNGMDYKQAMKNNNPSSEKRVMERMRKKWV